MINNECNTEQFMCLSCAYLQQSSSQVDRHEDGCQGGVSALHQVNSVEKDQVTGEHQQEEHLSRSVIGP